MSEFLTDDPDLLEGFHAWRSRKFAVAIEVFQRCLKRAPASADAWRGLGSVYWSLKQFEHALEAFQHALWLDPASAVHWSTVGLTLRDLKRFQQAQSTLRVAQAIDESYHPAWNECANVLFDLGEFARARPMYDRAIELCPTIAVYHHNRGECWLKLGQRRAAIDDFKGALSVDPNYGFSAARLRQLT